MVVCDRAAPVPRHSLLHRCLLFEVMTLRLASKSACVSEKVTRVNQRFTIKYPLFVLKRDSEHVVYSLDAESDDSRVGLPMFTSQVTVVAYLVHTGEQAQISIIDRVAVFRGLLRSMRDAGHVVLFDLRPDTHGNLVTEHVYTAAFVLENFLPELGRWWDYPVYLLRSDDGLFCMQSEHEGVPMKVLLVFTDDDLADRAIRSAPQPYVPLPIAAPEEFAHVLRALPPEVQAVAFDPPDAQGKPMQVRANPLRQFLAKVERQAGGE